MFTDTHCHLADPALRCRLPDIFAQAQQSGITGMIVPTAEPNDWAHLSDLLCQSMIRAGAIGIHPWFVQTESAGCLADLAQYLQHNPRLWLGEIGLDFYDKSQPETQSSLQIQLFEAQLDLAQQHQRPIILHNLKATAAIVRSLQRTQFTLFRAAWKKPNCCCDTVSKLASARCYSIHTPKKSANSPVSLR